MPGALHECTKVFFSLAASYSARTELTTVNLGMMYSDLLNGRGETQLRQKECELEHTREHGTAWRASQRLSMHLV